MTAPTEGIRILMYSHDTFGLGHLTRTLRIATAIRQRHPQASILILTGSPVAPYMPLPEGADFVKLPSVLKAGADHYESRNLEVNFKQIKRMRREVIRSTAETFQPHLFLVDNVPLGMKREIVPTLEMLRERFPHTRIALDLRDVLDDAEVIRDSWTASGVYEALDRFYDRIFVLGDPDLFDAVEAYGLPVDRSVFVGYATPGPRPNGAGLGDRFSDGGGPAKPRLLLTAGGGGDGLEFLHAALAGVGRRFTRADGTCEVEIEVVTGPLMDPEGRRRLAEEAVGCGAELLEFVPDLPARMRRADLVLAMAGYNTSCEILSHAQSALLYPRVAPRLEQKIRAKAMRDRGLAEMLDPADLDPDRIGEAAARVLGDGPRLASARLPRLEGQHRLAEELATLCPGLACRSGASEAGATPRGPETAPFTGENADSGSFSTATIVPSPRPAHRAADSGIKEGPGLAGLMSPIQFWPDAVSSGGAIGR